jgi:hypothetical protein
VLQRRPINSRLRTKETIPKARFCHSSFFFFLPSSLFYFCCCFCCCCRSFLFSFIYFFFFIYLFIFRLSVFVQQFVLIRGPSFPFDAEQENSTIMHIPRPINNNTEEAADKTSRAFLRLVVTSIRAEANYARHCHRYYTQTQARPPTRIHTQTHGVAAAAVAAFMVYLPIFTSTRGPRRRVLWRTRRRGHQLLLTSLF